MSLKKLKLLPAIILLCSGAAGAQESKCTAKLADLPPAQELRGFRPGMTLAQLRERLPGLQLRPADEFGFTSVNFFPDYEAGIDKMSFQGVRTVTLEFLDGRLTMLWVGYDKTFKWQSLDEFAEGMAGALKLQGAWRTRFRTRLLDCADFTLAVIPVGESPSIKLSDETARQLLDRRRAAKEEAEQRQQQP